jgi:hypothetical protein
MTSLRTLIHHQLANTQLEEHQQSIGFHGLSFFAEQSAWIRKYAIAEQE